MIQNIKRLLATLDHASAGGVTEVCVFRDGDVPTHVGYFDEHDAAANAIRAHDGRGNIYVTLNPAKRDLLARGNNRLVEGSFKRKLKRTKNGETVCDSWFFVDIDAERPSGISATDAELQAAIEAGIAVRDWLIAAGVPASAVLTAKSGNGTYVLVRLPDYKITPERIAIRAALLKYLARLFSTNEIKVDESVKNDARLMCALGTMKAKGENIPERPHRRSAIGTVGGEKFDAAKDQRCEPFDLYLLAEKLLPKEEPAPKPTVKGASEAPFNGQSTFDIRDYLDGLGESKAAHGFSYHTCPGCRGAEKLYVNTATGAYGCFHIPAGTCSLEAIRAALGRPKGAPAHVAQQPDGVSQAAPQSVQNGHSVHDLTKPEPWDLPVSFREFDLPFFPLEALSSWHRAYVEQLAEATQTPADLAAMQSLAAIAATIARNVEIEARQGWREPLCIFTLAVAESANRKSAVVSEVTRPLERFEGDLLAEMREKIAEAVNERKILEARLEKAQKDCAKLDGAELAKRKAEAREIAIEIEHHVIPVAPRFFVDDCTSEALASKMAEQGGRIALLSAEGGIFETMAGRYSNGAPNIDVYLKGHAGDSLRVDRRQRSERIERPALTIGLAVQSDVIRGLAQKPGFRGRGLLGRFLYSLPPSRLGSRKSRANSVSTEALHTYERYLIRLAAIKPNEVEDGEPEPITLRLSGEADDHLAQFQDEIEPELAEGGEYATISEWAGKLCGAAVRLAGILHCADHAMNAPRIPGEVPADTFKRAIQIARYLIPHSLAAHAEMGADPLIEDARYILRWLIRERLDDASKRDIHRGCRRFKKITELDPILALLEDHNYLRPLLPPAGDGAPRPGRKASSLYAVNPALHLGGQKGQKGQNPVKSAEVATGENDGYLGGQKGQKGQNTPETVNSVLSVLSVLEVDEWNFAPEPGGEHAEIVPLALPATPQPTPAKRRVSL